MPYKMFKLKSGRYQVKNMKTHRIVAKNTSKRNAERQIKLLNWIDGVN